MTAPDRLPPEPHAPESVRSDRYREWDAAYVLGALSPAERREFEEHLARCSGCQSAVAELAGMPGLLAQISPEVAIGLRVSETGLPTGTDEPDLPLPDSLKTPRAVPEVLSSQVTDLDARRRRRLTAAVVALAAALVLVVGVVGVAALRGAFPGVQNAVSAPFRLAFSPVVPSGVIAVVDVVPVAGGTELRVECQYAEEDPNQPGAKHAYDIVVRDRAGHATTVKTWTARPNHLMTPTGMTSLPVSKIAAVEIRPQDSDQPLLRAELPS